MCENVCVLVRTHTCAPSCVSFWACVSPACATGAPRWKDHRLTAAARSTRKKCGGGGGNPLQTHWNPSRSSYVFRCCSLVGDRPPTSCIKHGDQAAHYNTGLAALLPHSVSRVSAKSVTICPTQSWRRIGSRKGVLECSVWVGHASHVFVGLFDRDSLFRITNVFMMGCIYSIYT